MTASQSRLPLTTHPSRLWTKDVQREVLPNGLTLLVQPDHSAPVVSVVTHVKAGFFDEPDHWTGISHVLEHMFFKGTPRRGVGAIARETKAAGGYLNAGTGYDHTSYFTVLPASGLKTALEIQSDALLNSVIDEGELARELQVIIQEARRKRDTPGAVARGSAAARRRADLGCGGSHPGAGPGELALPGPARNRNRYLGVGSQLCT